MKHMADIESVTSLIPSRSDKTTVDSVDSGDNPMLCRVVFIEPPTFSSARIREVTRISKLQISSERDTKLIFSVHTCRRISLEITVKA